jgi:hypothetical protein
MVRRAHNTVELLREEGEIGWLTGDGKSMTAHVAALFTRDGEKWKCNEPLWFPVMRSCRRVTRGWRTTFLVLGGEGDAMSLSSGGG